MLVTDVYAGISRKKYVHSLEATDTFNFSLDRLKLKDNKTTAMLNEVNELASRRMVTITYLVVVNLGLELFRLELMQRWLLQLVLLSILQRNAVRHLLQ